MIAPSDLPATSTLPLHSQIAAAIRGRIESGQLPVGTRLLSSRDLADKLGVNRNIVVQSYLELKGEGWIESGVGRGSFVARPRPDGATATASANGNGRLSWAGLLRTSSHDGIGLAEEAPAPTATSLARAVGRHDMFPLEAVRRTLDQVFVELGADALGYAPPMGYEPLRESVRRRLEARGVDMSGREVLVVGGSQQGLDLVSRLLPAGGSVLTSTPSFSGALRVFEHEHECIGAPFDAGGLDPDGVQTLLRRQQVRLIYTIPFCHNPTGVIEEPARGDRLLELAQRHSLPILEDDWLGDLRAAGDPPSLAARDGGGHVIYLGTVSKVLVPGLRVGWLVAPRGAFDQLVALKCSTDLASNLPAQAALHRLLESGFYDSHVAKLRVILERRRTIVCEAIDRWFPAEVRPLAPGRGMVLWVNVPTSVDLREVVRESARQGVIIASGEPFLPGGVGPHGLRICYAEAAEEELAPAIKKLGRVLESALAVTPMSASQPFV